MKISKKVRDEAILICLCAASNTRAGEYYGIIATRLGLGAGKPLYAACAAMAAVDGILPTEGYRHVDAEAAALLADGWCPGDPVVLLRGGG
jgi:hypothetical protein